MDLWKSSSAAAEPYFSSTSHEAQQPGPVFVAPDSMCDREGHMRVLYCVRFVESGASEYWIFEISC